MVSWDVTALRSINALYILARARVARRTANESGGATLYCAFGWRISQPPHNTGDDQHSQEHIVFDRIHQRDDVLLAFGLPAVISGNTMWVAEATLVDLPRGSHGRG